MPVYKEENFNYEVLLRFGDVEPYKGLLRGAHRQTITQTTKDGVVIATNINPPEQLALISGEEGDLLANVLGEINAETIVLNGRLQNSLSELSGIVSQQLEQIAKLQSDLDIALSEIHELSNLNTG